MEGRSEMTIRPILRVPPRTLLSIPGDFTIESAHHLLHGASIVGTEFRSPIRTRGSTGEMRMSGDLRQGLPGSASTTVRSVAPWPGGRRDMSRGCLAFLEVMSASRNTITDTVGSITLALYPHHRSRDLFIFIENMLSGPISVRNWTDLGGGRARRERPPGPRAAPLSPATLAL